MTSDEHRRADLVTSLGSVRSRIAGACARVGRDPREVTLVAVTKTYPAADVATLHELGVLDVGESRDQEVRAKIDELGELTPALRWHFVGRLQTNKAARIARYATAVHSVDRVEVVTALGTGARDREAPVQVFVQASLDGDPTRGGASGTELFAVADAVAGTDGLHLTGVMAVPPIGAELAASFAEVAEISAKVRAAHPEAIAISAGMSSDFETALEHGATHLRVGTALLGRRA